MQSCCSSGPLQQADQALQGADALEKVPKELSGKLAKLRHKRATLLAAIVQDLADSLLALNDIAGEAALAACKLHVMLVC